MVSVHISIVKNKFVVISWSIVKNQFVVILVFCWEQKSSGRRSPLLESANPRTPYQICPCHLAQGDLYESGNLRMQRR